LTIEEAEKYLIFNVNLIKGAPTSDLQLAGRSEKTEPYAR
jgi:hypothetical protein